MILFCSRQLIRAKWITRTNCSNSRTKKKQTNKYSSWKNPSDCSESAGAWRCSFGGQASTDGKKNWKWRWVCRFVISRSCRQGPSPSIATPSASFSFLIFTAELVRINANRPADRFIYISTRISSISGANDYPTPPLNGCNWTNQISHSIHIFNELPKK